MKRKMIWSLAALLAGTGFAAAQDVEVASGRLVNTGTAQSGTIAQHEAAVGCSTGCSSFGNDYRIYGRVEALVWQLGSSLSDNGLFNLPNFRQTMPYGFHTTAYDLTNPQVPVPRPGVDGNKDISGLALLEPSILTGSGLDGIDRLGARITLGMALDSAHDWYGEISYFQLETKGAQYVGTASVQNVQFTTGLKDIVLQTTVGTNGVPVVTAVETPVIFNADLSAAITGSTSSKLFGLEANVSHRSFTVGNTKFSEIYGLRYVDFTINQSVSQSLTVSDDRYVVDPANGNNPVGSSTTFLFGNYEAHNQFYGAQVGARFDSDFGRFYMNGFGKFGFGAMQQHLTVNEDVVNQFIAIPFDVYPAPTVMNETRTRAAFLLEGNLSAGFHVTDNLSVMAGYNVIVMTRVAQLGGGNVTSGGPGSITLGSTQAPIPIANIFQEGRYYAHGLTLGLELRY